MYNVLALDLSFSCTGWAAISDGVIESGTQSFEPPRRPRGCKKPKPLPALRFARFGAWLCEMIEVQRPALIIVERAHHNGWAATQCGVGLGTRVEEVCAVRGIVFEAVHSGTLKKYATGNGNAKKSEMIEAARKRWDFYTGENDEGGDESDASMLLALAMERDEARQ